MHEGPKSLNFVCVKNMLYIMPDSVLLSQYVANSVWYSMAYLVEKFAHISSHGEVERGQSPRVPGNLTGSSS